MATPIQTAKLNAADPQACFADVLTRIANHPLNTLDALLPWTWAEAKGTGKLAA